MLRVSGAFFLFRGTCSFAFVKRFLDEDEPKTGSLDAESHASTGLQKCYKWRYRHRATAGVRVLFWLFPFAIVRTAFSLGGSSFGGVGGRWRRL